MHLNALISWAPRTCVFPSIYCPIYWLYWCVSFESAPVAVAVVQVILPTFWCSIFWIILVLVSVLVDLWLDAISETYRLPAHVYNHMSHKWNDNSQHPSAPKAEGVILWCKIPLLEGNWRKRSNAAWFLKLLSGLPWTVSDPEPPNTPLASLCAVERSCGKMPPFFLMEWKPQHWVPTSLARMPASVLLKRAVNGSEPCASSHSCPRQTLAWTWSAAMLCSVHVKKAIFGSYRWLFWTQCLRQTLA